MNKFIPLYEPYFVKKDKKIVSKCLDDTWVSTSGPLVEKFEQKIVKQTKCRYAVACSSGTAALHLALIGIGVKKNDLVLVSNLTFIASVNVIKYVGAEPILFDCDKKTWQIDEKLIQNFLENECYSKSGCCFYKKTKQRIGAILPVHILGHTTQIDKIVKLGMKFKIPTVEDAAESFGAKFKKKQLGSFGKVGCFSFNGNKIITTASGGVVVTNQKSLAKKIKHFSQQAKSSKIDYIHNHIGFNYRMNNLCASLGLTQLEKLDFFIKQKEKIADIYIKGFKKNKFIKLIKQIEFSKPNWWLFTILINHDKIDAKMMYKKLLENGIQTRRLWQPMNLSIPYKNSIMIGGNNSFNLYKNALSLPSSVSLKKNDQIKVIKLVNYFLINSVK